MRLITLIFLCLPLVAQASLYKCLDNAGRVTYTNAACDKAGLKEATLIAPPPPPAVDAPVVQTPPTVKLSASKPRSTGFREIAPKEAPLRETALQSALQGTPLHEMPTAKLAMNRIAPSSTGNCDKMNEQLGRVMDDMDAARRAGYTAQQEAGWNQRISGIQSEKSRMGCF